jgi:hypothetical protein
VIIDIAKKVNVPVLFHGNSHIEDQHGNSRSKIDPYIIPALMHGLLNSFQVPAGSIAKKKGCESRWILHVDAPMACHPF